MSPLSLTSNLGEDVLCNGGPIDPGMRDHPFLYLIEIETVCDRQPKDRGAINLFIA